MSEGLSQKNVVMLVGLGHAGTRAVVSSAGQFDVEGLGYGAGDVSNEIINLEEPAITSRYVYGTGWDEHLTEDVAGLEMVVLIVGLGGVTGVEMAKSFIKACTAAGTPMMLVVTMPFNFESEERLQLAEKQLAALRTGANAVVVIPNELLFETMPATTVAVAAFEQADGWIAEVVTSILRPFTQVNVINIDKANLAWLVKQKNSTCAVGIGWGEGENAIVEAVEELSNSPFLRLHVSHDEVADAALVMVSLPEDATIAQVRGCLGAVKRLFSPTMKLEIGACQDDSLGEGIRVVAMMRFVYKKTATVPVEGETEEGSSVEARPTRRKRLVHDDDKQLFLPMSIKEQKTGIFNPKIPTKHNFINVDIPTYVRLNIDIETVN